MHSWVGGVDEGPYTLATLPYGMGLVARSATPHLLVAVAGSVLDLTTLRSAGNVRLPETPAASVNDLLRLPRSLWRQWRERLTELLEEGASEKDAMRPHLHALADVPTVLPFTVGDYVDFYSSLEHATNLGRILRPDGEPLLANWRHLPVGYHGRSSTVVVSGTPIVRPRGQTVEGTSGKEPTFGPTRMLDFELEVGFVTGGEPNRLGRPISVDDAEEHIYGMVLVNDWSARDIQSWEYQPLGPFLAKSFATSISPWLVPLEALEPHRIPAPDQHPSPLPYLQEALGGRRGIALDLEVDVGGTIVTRTSFAPMYWTMAQQLAHLSSNGAVVRPGDLYASGTVSGSAPGSQGSLIELTHRGANPIILSDGTERGFLHDGDTVTMRGWCGAGMSRVTFGEVSGTVEPAHDTRT